jgi:hypothetical protein
MRIRLKPINEQVVVITGGSSGIGLATRWIWNRPSTGSARMEAMPRT